MSPIVWIMVPAEDLGQRGPTPTRTSADEDLGQRGPTPTRTSAEDLGQRGLTPAEELSAAEELDPVFGLLLLNGWENSQLVAEALIAENDARIARADQRIGRTYYG